MTEPTGTVNKFQWKWVGITLAMYLVFYLLPLVFGVLLIRSGGGNIGITIVGAWLFGGIIIVAAVAGYLSKGVTILEPAIASISMIFLWMLTFLLAGVRFDIRNDTLPTIAVICGVFLLSLFGAWFGERAQKLWKKTPEEETKSALIATGQKGLTRSGMILGIIGTFVTLLVIIAVGVSLFRAQSVVSNKDALINDLNNLAAFSYQYRIRPTSMEGGNGAYTGLKMPEQLGTNENGTFTFTVIGPDEVKIKAVSKQVEGAAIETTLDGDGRLGRWTYFGKFM